jgi:Nup133 N terminal like
VPVSYAEEQQAIATVQLVQPRPGVFAEAINHLLVICTTTEASGQSPHVCLGFLSVTTAGRGATTLRLAMLHACCC